ncbi:MAG TPA: aminotransferase class III-fold pyridoxal phosphate-dependent enzyme, partial [Spirochaetota bacterium]|nr:aminotransferase class III-fold pyridoxal phosphate-dependent enzyme [Spirochaetota bacterium]
VENACRKASEGFFKIIRQVCSSTGALMVIDETQTGMGRTGKRFAFEHYGIQPDILVIGEALGAGIFPIAATVFTKKVQKFMHKNPLIHLSTFGGHDLGCRVAYEALELYEKIKPWENAHAVGQYLLDKLFTLQRIYPDAMISVNGQGLVAALTLKNEDMANRANVKLAREGIFAVHAKVATDTILLRPALTIAKRDVDDIIRAIGKIIKSI